MKMFSRILLLVLTFGFLSPLFAADLSPVGYWRTIDDVTGKPKAIIQISANADKILSGRILKIFPRPGYDQNEVCTACDGAKHNQRIVGMVILEDLKPSKDDATAWEDGQILDPKTGKVYHASITMIDDGARLKVRGYIGTPLFGRTQTWIRVSAP